MLIFFLLFACSQPLFASGIDSLDSPEAVLLEMLKNRENIENLRFDVVFRHQSFSDIEARERKFSVLAKRSVKNPIYKFNWLLTDHTDIDSSQYLFSEKDVLYITNVKKIILWEQNVDRVNRGDYLEFLRENLLFEEIFLKGYDFNKIDSLAFNPHQDDDFFVIDCFLNPRAAKTLWIDRKSFFPMKVKTVFTHGNLKRIEYSEIHNLVINKGVEANLFHLETHLNRDFKVNILKRPDEAEIMKTLSSWKFDEGNLELFSTFRFWNHLTDSLTFDSLFEENRILVLDFYFLACLPCLQSMPQLQKLSDRYKNKGVKFLGVNDVDGKNPQMVISKLRERGISYATVFCEQGKLSEIGVMAFPSIVMVDKSGEVLYAQMGMYEQGLELAINEALARMLKE